MSPGGTKQNHFLDLRWTHEGPITNAGMKLTLVRACAATVSVTWVCPITLGCGIVAAVMV